MPVSFSARRGRRCLWAGWEEHFGVTVSLSVFPLKEKILNGFRKKENHNVASYSLCMYGVFVILCCLPLTLFPCKVFCFFEGSGISGWKKARLFLFEASEQCPTSLGCYKKQLWSWILMEMWLWFIHDSLTWSDLDKKRKNMSSSRKYTPTLSLLSFFFFPLLSGRKKTEKCFNGSASSLPEISEIPAEMGQ